MEDLFFNEKAEFSRWVTSKGFLQEPFVVVDVGVQGGANRRWDVISDHVVFHGFDAIDEVIAGLKDKNVARPDWHFHAMALGRSDEERDFFVNSADPFSSSMFRQGMSRFDGQPIEKVRRVSVRTLDSLFADAVIPRCDFLKVDVEGFEKEVFLGAGALLAAGVLGIETETNFNISAVYPKSHLITLAELLLEHHFLICDLGFNRVPRASFQRSLARKGLALRPRSVLGGPATINVLFCRDLIHERDNPEDYTTPCGPVSPDQIIKSMIIHELHGLNDIALDTMERFSDQLGSRFDLDHAIKLLADPQCRFDDQSLRDEQALKDQQALKQVLQNEPALERALKELSPEQVSLLAQLQRNINDLEHSTSWRITAPLRAAKKLLSHVRRS